MPAIYGTRKHWWIFLVIGVIINMTAVFVYLRLNQIASGNNHMYCTMTANAVFGVVAYFFISLIINRWSTSAKKIPVKLF